MNKKISVYIFQFILGVFLISAGSVTYAAVNSNLVLPPSGNVGDILTAEYWNRVVEAVKNLDNRTREIKTETNGNTAIGGDTNGSGLPLEKLDVRGAIKIGNTENNNEGAIRYTGSDFEGYSDSEWKSLTKGTDGAGGSCTPASSGESFSTGTAVASCSEGSISYSAVEWEANPGRFYPSFALSSNPTLSGASINCLGNGCKVQLICCTGGAGSGGSNDLLAGLTCNNDETIKWNGDLYKWACSNEVESTETTTSIWTEINENAIRSSGRVGIGTNDPRADLDVNGKIKSTSTVASDAGTTVTTKDYVDAKVGSGSGTTTSAAGQTGEIQFNNGGSFWTDGNFFWDNTNKRLGIGTNTPSQKLDVNGDTKITGRLDISSHISSKGTVTAKDLAVTQIIEGSIGPSCRMNLGLSNNLEFQCRDGAVNGLQTDQYKSFLNLGSSATDIASLYKALKVFGKITSSSTASTDSGTTVTTKDYVDTKVANLVVEPPVCTGTNKALQWSGSAWSCAVIASSTTTSTGSWYTSTGSKSCTTVCAVDGKVSSPDPSGKYCASGESPKTDTFSTEVYSKSYTECTNQGSEDCHAYETYTTYSCYKSNQKKDYDLTDLVNSCFCK